MWKELGCSSYSINRFTIFMRSYSAASIVTAREGWPIWKPRIIVVIGQNLYCRYFLVPWRKIRALSCSLSTGYPQSRSNRPRNGWILMLENSANFENNSSTFNIPIQKHCLTVKWLWQFLECRLSRSVRSSRKTWESAANTFPPCWYGTAES